MFSFRVARKTSRDISLAPRLARCSVCIWQSIIATPWACRCRTMWTKASLDASRRRETQSAVVEPTRAVRVHTGRPELAGWRASIERRDPHLDRVAVRRLDARADGVGDPASVGRELGIADGLDDVIILDRECATLGGRGGARRRDDQRQREDRARDSELERHGVFSGQHRGLAVTD